MQNAKCGMQNEFPDTAERSQKEVVESQGNRRILPLEVHIRLDKERGDDTGICILEGAGLPDKFYGVAVLIRHLGRTSGIGTEGVLARLATLLLTEKGGGADAGN